MQWFADLRIAYKIAIVPLALGLLLVVLGVVSTLSLRSIASRVDVVTQGLGPSMDQLTSHGTLAAEREAVCAQWRFCSRTAVCCFGSAYEPGP